MASPLKTYFDRSFGLLRRGTSKGNPANLAVTRTNSSDPDGRNAKQRPAPDLQL